MRNLETKWRIKFYLEKRNEQNNNITNPNKMPIYMFVTFGKNERMQFYARENVLAEHMDAEYLVKVKKDRYHFRPIKPQVSESRSINGRLEKLAQETVRLIESAFNSDPPKELTKEYLKDTLKLWMNGEEVKKDTESISLGAAMDEYKKYSELHHATKTVSGFKQVRDNVEAYIMSIKMVDLSLEEVDQKFIDGFETFLIKKKINGKSISNNTLAKNLKKLKTLLLWCRDQGWFEYNLRIKYKENEGAIISLTFAEYEQLQNAKLSNETLDRTRDVFIFGINTGLRYGDLMALKKNDFRDGRIWFYEQKKKATFERSIKLVPKALAIVEKYKDLPGEKLLPAYSNPNVRLKEVFSEANIDRNVTLVRKTAGGKMEKTVVPLSKLVHSHMQRKTFITLGLTMGIPEVVLKSITGHTKDSSSFRRYYNIIDSVKDDAMDNTFGKL